MAGSSPQASSEDMKSSYPRSGKVCWIGLRPGRKQAIEVVDQVSADVDHGLIGDRFSGKPGADRQVTLIQQEHLQAVAQLLGVAEIDPGLARRNIVVSGINLTSLKGAEFTVGDVVLRGTGACPPCSRMEHNLGPGGFNAMRGHGGITACVVRSGTISVGDTVDFIGRIEHSPVDSNT